MYSIGSMIDSLFKVDGQFPCPKCEKSYVHLRNLHRHLKNECGIEPSYQCPWCPKKCRYNFTLKSHIFGKKYSCLRCENKYKYKRELIQHQSNKCGVPPKFYCSECQKSFKQSTNYKLHMMKIHCGIYSCLRCGHKYKYKRGLIQHQTYECGVPPRFYCSECQKSFKQPASYKLHMMKIHFDFSQ